MHDADLQQGKNAATLSTISSGERQVFCLEVVKYFIWRLLGTWPGECASTRGASCAARPGEHAQGSTSKTSRRRILYVQDVNTSYFVRPRRQNDVFCTSKTSKRRILYVQDVNTSYFVRPRRILSYLVTPKRTDREAPTSE